MDSAYTLQVPLGWPAEGKGHVQGCFRCHGPVSAQRALPLTSGRGLQGRVPLTLPLPPAVARADALELVPPGVLLAPGLPDAIGCHGVLVVASVCVRKEAFRDVSQVKLAHAQLKL